MVTISDSRTTIPEGGEGEVSDLNGTKKKIMITPELVANAVHLSNQGNPITKRKKKIPSRKRARKKSLLRGKGGEDWRQRPSAIG